MIIDIRQASFIDILIEQVDQTFLAVLWETTHNCLLSFAQIV